jgi:ferredoxin
VAGLHAALLCTAAGDAARLGPGSRALAGALADVSGWMGAFRAAMRTAQGPVDLAPLSSHADGHFDWIVEFDEGGQAMLPPGRYRLPADDYPAIKRTLLEIARYRREGYRKPRYFNFDAARCAHERQSVAGCSACLPACAAGAIGGGKGNVHIEPHLCQGCAACALVCPTGAVRFAWPDTGTSLVRLNTLLTAWRAAGGETPGLWIRAESDTRAAPAGWLAFPMATAAAAGMEFWLAALAVGCGRVAIAPGTASDASRAAMDSQLAIVHALLEGLGLPRAIDLGETPERLAGMPALPRHPAAGPASTDDKRALLDAALAALTGIAGATPTQVALPAGAPLGAVEVDPVRCTLCAACIRICPSDALSHPGAIHQLAFTESRCTQCGLCAGVCPERAIRLLPRYLVSAEARARPRVVAEADWVACAGCGKPYASRAMLERSRALMADHPMFQGDRAALLSLCMECRQKSMAGAMP